MKINPRNRFLILISLGLLVGSLLIIDNTPNLNSREFDSNALLQTSQISGKIYIDNNWTDTKNAELCTGSGTSTDPYVIEDLEIDANNTGSCILIKSSNEYFKIENCTLINSGSELVDAGILLIHADNAEIIDNTILNNYMGIDLKNSHNCTPQNSLSYKLASSLRIYYYFKFVSHINKFYFSGSLSF